MSEYKFELTKKQKENFQKWSQHCSTYAGAIGGRIAFRFTPTGLGVIAEAECICGEKINLTECVDWRDYETR